MGEEEATMRERLVEAIFQVIHNGELLPCGTTDEQDSRFIAERALDAALDLLETPSEEMIVAGGKAMHWDGWRHDVDDENFTPEEYEADPQLRRSFERTARPTWQSMLATLRSPKI